MKKATISLLFGIVFLVLFVSLNHVKIAKCDITSTKLNTGQTLSSKSVSSSEKYKFNYKCEINSLRSQENSKYS